jgi:hypothetical protein
VREIGALLSSTTGVMYRCNVHLQIELITNIEEKRFMILNVKWNSWLD